ncbi:MAG: bifunctional 4-hydroxy-2-oxoglutarate aldolase/2-dehydro-3-deoxy-phosphogluconate aldolase [Planctomycetota bacterium]
MESLFSAALLERIQASRIISVLVVENAVHAVHVAMALLRGGVDAMELTLRTPSALDCIRAIRAEVPQMIVGAGTILFPRQVQEVLSAGAAFGVAPGTNPEVIREAVRLGLPFAPGVVTPTDIDIAVQCGCRELKYFPAEPSGGLAMLSSIKAPFAHLGLKYIPLGGVTPGNLRAYLADPDVIAVGGSWLAKAESIRAERWDEIERNAQEARSIADCGPRRRDG